MPKVFSKTLGDSKYEINSKEPAQKLTDLDKMAEGLDDLLKDLRVEINNVLWDLVEMRKSKKST